MTRMFSIACGAVLAGALIVSAGCTTARAPELQSTAQTGPQDAITVSRVNSNNLRGIWDDLGRLFFFDQNSGLTPYVVP